MLLNVNLCDTSAGMWSFYIVKTFISIVCVIIPLIIIVNSFRLLFGSVITAEKIKENAMQIMKSVIAGLIVFFIPTMMNFVFGTLIEFDDSSLSECYTSSSMEKVQALREKEAIEKEKMRKQQEKENEEALKKKAEDEKKKKEQMERNEKADEKKDDNNNDNNNNNNNNNNGDNTSNSSDLNSKISNYLSSQQGSWSVVVINTKDNSTVNINGDSRMVAASTIKLFIMEYLYNLASKGQANVSDFRNDVRLMIQNSDNDATNRLIDRYGMGNINSYITSKYSGSTLQRKMLTSGNENYVSASDLAKILKSIHDGNLISKEYSNEMLGFLKNQTRTGKIPAGVPSGVVVANKTGENTGVENDAGIVYSSGGDYVIVVLGNQVESSSGISVIREVSSMTYNHYN